ncbi:MAG: hypothetical protein ACREJ2_11480 [Planctomycetota bacterium]
MNEQTVKTLIRKGDQVAVIRGEARNLVQTEKKGGESKPAVATVDRIDRKRGRVWLRVELERQQDSMGRQKPVRGLEVYKNVKFNPQNNEPGGTRVVPRAIELSNIQLRCPKCGRVGAMHAVRKRGIIEEGRVRNGLKKDGVIVKRVCKGSSKKPGCNHEF